MSAKLKVCVDVHSCFWQTYFVEYRDADIDPWILRFKGNYSVNILTEIGLFNSALFKKPPKA